ncbi:hypothetical protein CEUSTIGMA_g10841.t1 [Chlamydomonas eustigma]|uniref:Enoyl reductase (ER) domain-containing protein n=1 Tax=Chlamydomonas eustigma TaxID=1157962 RepID=A0A250XK71_9CHLO|nr:hypothetical protein CEUSTIGMA_g10841.t1 [Chlamydomonas eustigma]|eukprot:GAX83416.1 hypothetical protein CEUSTIGMA_g10841.t1 [Chlamydomonas eustigma]
MPRIKSAPDAKSLPREFALFTQLKPDASGNVDKETLATYQKLYGDVTATPKDEMSIEDFSALFSRPKVKADGDGNTLVMATHSADGKFSPYRINRRAVGDYDVKIQITHASICHTDIHNAYDEWHGSKYPMVPGHEIAGIVTEVGPKVTKFKPGDKAGVGCMVNSCKACQYCEDGEEQYCAGGFIATYNGTDKDGTTTYGGYSTNVVVVESFVLRIPDSLPLEGVAPLLCAGITVYSPLKYYGLDKPGMHIAVVGLGGLGAHAVRFAKAFGCKVTVISTSPSKEKEAKEQLGADHFLVSKDEEAMKAAAKSLDGILDTVSATHDLGQLLALLKTSGTMVCVGAPGVPPAMPTFAMLMRRLTVGGSLIGGIKQTQEMLEFCAQHNLVLPYETISADYVETAYQRILKSDVRYRFVINVQGTLVQ